MLQKLSTPPSCNRANSICLCGLDIVASITDHPARSFFEAADANQSGQQVRLSVAQVFSLVAINRPKEPGKSSLAALYIPALKDGAFRALWVKLGRAYASTESVGASAAASKVPEAANAGMPPPGLLCAATGTREDVVEMSRSLSTALTVRPVMTAIVGALSPRRAIS
jgi:hypothetical protein